MIVGSFHRGFSFILEVVVESGIYQIRNKINGHSYIGQAANLKERPRRHLSNAKVNKRENAYNLYGRKAFEIIILEIVTANNLLELKIKLKEREQY